VPAKHLLKRAETLGLVEAVGPDRYRLTTAGARQAAAADRAYRMWRLLIVECPELAAGASDLDFEAVEATLPDKLRRELEARLDALGAEGATYQSNR
jgi:Mn-dependent DtxR family transcriptional regulator